MSFDAIIRTLFSDSGLSIGLAKANAALRQLEQSGPGASRGVKAAEQGLRTLAFQAAGLPGPLGRVADGLLRFGGGSAAVLAVTAGIGLVVGAYKLLNQSAEETKKANEALIESMARLGPIAAKHAELLKNRLAAAQLETASPYAFLGAQFGVGKTRDEQLAELASARVRLQTDLNVLLAEQGDKIEAAWRASIGLTEEQRKAIEAWVAARRESGELRLGIWQLAPPGQTPNELAARTWQGAFANSAIAHPNFSQFATPGMPDTSGMVRGFDDVGAMIDATIKETNKLLAPDLDETKALVVASFGAMAQAAILGSDQMARGFITGMAAILQSIPGVGPVAGSIIGAVGGIFGALFGGHKEIVPVKVMNPEDFNRGPSRITEIIVSPGGEELSRTRYELSRRQRLDATDRSGG